MKRRKWLFIALSLALLASCVGVLAACHGKQAGTADDARVSQGLVPSRADDVRLEALITSLQTKGSAKVNPWYELEHMGEPQFAGSFFEPFELEKEEPYDPTIRGIVGLGVRALPKLLEHLSDARKTQMEVRVADLGGMGAIMWSAEYDPRYRDPTRQPKVTYTGEGVFDGPSTYVLTVGDLCKLAVGEIVNRSLWPVRPQPTNCIMINSTSHNKSLAEAIRKDWAGLTADDHRMQLEQDALSINFQFHGGIKRMLFFYPKQGEALAVKLLNRPIKDTSRILDAQEQMVKTDDPAKWRAIYEKAVKKYGAEAASINADYMHYTYVERNDPLYVTKHESERAKKILPTIFPAFKAYENRFYNLTHISEHRDLVAALKRFPSNKIDAAVQSVFRRAIKDPTGFGDRIKTEGWPVDQLDELTLHCFARMRGKGYDAEYVRYFRRRVKEVPKPDMDHMSGSCIQQMRTWLKELSKSTGKSGG